VPILVSIVLVIIFGFLTYNYLYQEEKVNQISQFKGDFKRVRSCKILPKFLAQKARKGIIIDLSQQKFKGVAFWYGSQKKELFYNKDWAKYGYFGTYTIDKFGNIYFAPMPMISIEKDTFEAQHWIYEMDRKGDLTKWLRIDEVVPSNSNPYGIISLDYDCDDNSLWVSSIDKSNYTEEAGRIYKIDIKDKKVISKWEGYDVFTIKIMKTSEGKYLLFGSAREPALFSWKIENGLLTEIPQKLFELPDPTMRIRKIRVIGTNRLSLEAIKFTYSLIAESSDDYRYHFIAVWDSKKESWKIEKLKD
jgi:hypothetical protein